MSDTEFRIVISATEVTGSLRQGPEDEWLDLEGGSVVRDHLRTVQVLEDWLKRWQLLTALDEGEPKIRVGQNLFVRETIEVLGTRLWKMALDNDIGEAIVAQHYREEDGLAGNMRLRISFDDAPQLALLPWEFLQYPGSRESAKFWLAVEAKLVLGRFVEGPGDLKIAVADDRLRAVFVRHLPGDPHFKPQLEACKKLVAELVKDDATKERMETREVEYRTAEDLNIAMRAFRSEDHRVDVVHLTALFRMHEGSCEVYLPFQSGGQDWMDADTLVESICGEQAYRPTLVVLHLVDQAHGDFMLHSEQLAPAFIIGGVPAVLAMQYPMTPKEANTFLMKFYRDLARGKPIGEAVQMSRKKLRLGKPNRPFGSPVLYMQSATDGQLIKTLPDEQGAPEIDEEVTLEASPERQAVDVLRSAPDRSRKNIRTRLLQVLDSPDLDTAVVWRVRGVIREQTWPDDEGAAREQLRRILRGQQDDPAQARVYERLIAELTGTLRGRK